MHVSVVIGFDGSSDRRMGGEMSIVILGFAPGFGENAGGGWGKVFINNDDDNDNQ